MTRVSRCCCSSATPPLPSVSLPALHVRLHSGPGGKVKGHAELGITSTQWKVQNKQNLQGANDHEIFFQIFVVM